jgi:hypothetical protein
MRTSHSHCANSKDQFMFSGVLASSSIKSLIRKAGILIQVKIMKTELAGERSGYAYSGCHSTVASLVSVPMPAIQRVLNQLVRPSITACRMICCELVCRQRRLSIRPHADAALTGNVRFWHVADVPSRAAECPLWGEELPRRRQACI